MVFSYFLYAAAFAREAGSIDVRLVAISLMIAPFVFVVLGFGSGNPRAPRGVLRAMVVLPVVGLAFGLIAPVLGASLAFAVGGALTLRQPDIENVMRWRFVAIGLTGVYLLMLLVTVVPAGLFAGGFVPLPMLGFADEYARWSSRHGQSSQ